jgi:hypothetical protein
MENKIMKIGYGKETKAITGHSGQGYLRAEKMLLIHGADID